MNAGRINSGGMSAVRKPIGDVLERGVHHMHSETARGAITTARDILKAGIDIPESAGIAYEQFVERENQRAGKLLNRFA